MVFQESHQRLLVGFFYTNIGLMQYRLLIWVKLFNKTLDNFKILHIFAV